MVKYANYFIHFMNNKKYMKKGKKIGFFACVMAIWMCMLWYSVLKTDSKDLIWVYNWFIDVVTSIDDEIRENSVRCGSFQLAWNDFIKDMWLESQNFWGLSKQTFKSNYISENNYYNNFWLFTLDLKSEIEKWVLDKFKEWVKPKFISDWSIIPQSADYYEWKKEKKYAVYSKFKKSINLNNLFVVVFIIYCFKYEILWINELIYIYLS